MRKCVAAGFSAITGVQRVHVKVQYLDPAFPVRQSHWNPIASMKNRVPCGPTPPKARPQHPLPLDPYQRTESAFGYATLNTPAAIVPGAPRGHDGINTGARALRAAANGTSAGGQGRNGLVVVVNSRSTRWSWGRGRCSVVTWAGRFGEDAFPNCRCGFRHCL